MIDRIFSAALTFCLLVAGTLAIGSALFGLDARSTQSARHVIELPAVTVTGQRSAAAAQTDTSTVASAQGVADCARPTPTRAPVDAETTARLTNI